MIAGFTPGLGSSCRCLALLVFAVGGALLTAACGDDVASLGARFEAKEQDDAQADYGPASPITVDQELWYTVAASLRRTTAGGEGGATVGEAQSAGSMCLRVTKVEDTATEKYKDAPQTIIVGQVKVTGPSGDATLTAHDQSNSGATPADVDGLLAGLWLKQITFPSAGHGFESPNSVRFATQQAPVSGASVTNLPFFEVRVLDDDRGHFWSGWEYRTDMSGAANMLGNLISAFPDPRAVAITTATPPANCPSFTSPRDCGNAECTWALPPGGNVSQCMPLYTARFVWRDQLAAAVAPAELAGGVLHEIELIYNTDGMLHIASEMIVPDNTNTNGGNGGNGGRLPSDLTSCAGSCLSAQISNAGEWAGGGYVSPCAF